MKDLFTDENPELGGLARVRGAVNSIECKIPKDSQPNGLALSKCAFCNSRRLGTCEYSATRDALQSAQHTYGGASLEGN
jgi:hypothetical protein